MPKLKERSTSWIATAPIQLQREAVIDAPASAVWAEFANNEGWVEWFPGFKACHFTSDAPHGVDSFRLVHQDQFKVSERLTEWEPNKRWGMTVSEINIGVLSGMAEVVEFTETGGQTTVTFTIGVELSKWAGILRRPLTAKSTTGLEQALVNLNQRVTGQAGSS